MSRLYERGQRRRVDRGQTMGSSTTRRRDVALPLLYVLKSMRPEHRVIVLAHLDDETRDLLYKTINRVLSSDRVPIRRRLLLGERLKPYKKQLRQLADEKRSPATKRRRLTQLGGGPMSCVLREAIPLLMHLFPK